MESLEPPELTKLARKQLRREQKQTAREAAARRAAARGRIRWLVAAGVLAVIVGGAYWLASRPAPGGEEPGETAVLDVQADDWVKGNPAAAVTLTEYGDFQCPACAAYHPLIKQLESEMGEQVRIVWRHFPLEQVHRHARAAALAAEAAGRQGNFWEMHDLLFERQPAWTGEPDVHGIFAGYAAELGLNREQFAADLESTELAARVKAQQDGGIRVRVNSTPTFFLNGERLESVRTYDDFKQRVLDALEGAA